MAKIDDLKAQAALIENETAIGGNTAKRVGGAIGTAAELIEQQANDLDATRIEIGHIDKSAFTETGFLKSTGELYDSTNWRTGYVDIPSGTRYVNIKNYSNVPYDVVFAITYDASGSPVTKVSMKSNDVNIDATGATRIRFSVEVNKLDICKVRLLEEDIKEISSSVKELQAEIEKREDAYQLVDETISSQPSGNITLVREENVYIDTNGYLANGQGYYGSNVYKVTGVSRLYISSTVKNNSYVRVWCALKNGTIVKKGQLTSVSNAEIVDVSSFEFDEIYVSFTTSNKGTVVTQKTQLLATLDDVNHIKKQIEPNTLFRELNFDFVQDKYDLLPALTEKGFLNYAGVLISSYDWMTGSLALDSKAKRVYLSSKKSANEAVYGCFVDVDGKQFGLFNNVKFPLYMDIPNGAVKIRVSLKINVDDLLFYALQKDVVDDIFKRFAQNESDISSLKSAIGSDVKIVAPSVFYAVVGNEFNVYYDTIIKGFDDGLNSPSNIYVNISCPDLGATKGVGAMRDRYWHIDGSKLNDTHIGDHTLVIRAFNVAGKEVDAKTCVLRVVSDAGLTKATNILCIGDSLTNNGPIVATMGAGFNSIGGTQPTFIGQRTTDGYKHEGYPGYTFASFSYANTGTKYYIFQVPIGTKVIVGDKYSSSGNVYTVGDIRTETDTTTSLRCEILSGDSTPSETGTLEKISGATSSAETINYSGYEYQSGNPFWNAQTSSVDVADYRKRMGMGADKFDIVVIMLGVNECVGEVKNMSFAVNDAKKLITAILNDAGMYSTKVILQPTPADASTPSSWQVYHDETGYSKKIGYWSNYWSLRALLEEEFTKAEYAGKVYIGQATLGVDRYYGYGISSITPAKRVSEGFSSLREDYHTNSVHPSTVGYKQFGDGYFLQALGLIKEQ